jgi:hypothetical protein
MAKSMGATAWKPEASSKGTSIGNGIVKLSSMNKSKKRSYKKYRGQGK